VAVDVDEIVRTRRRQQALDALDFEHGRETAVLAQIDEVLTELEGSRIDEAAFAHMAPEDVALVRGVLDPGSDEPEDEFDLEGALASESPAEIRRESEAERVRLEEVIAASRSRQQALERYIEALDAKGDAPGAGQTLPD
jgi:hypothetical protein